MSPVAEMAVIERPAILGGQLGQRSAVRTLADDLSATWKALGHARAACLVCGGELRARWGAGASPVAAQCPTCGTEVT